MDIPGDHEWAYTANELNQYPTVTEVAADVEQGMRYDADGNLIVEFIAADMNCDGLVNTLDTLSGVKRRLATPTRL